MVRSFVIVRNSCLSTIRKVISEYGYDKEVFGYIDFENFDSTAKRISEKYFPDIKSVYDDMPGPLFNLKMMLVVDGDKSTSISLKNCEINSDKDLKRYVLKLFKKLQDPIEDIDYLSKGLILEKIKIEALND